MLEGKHGETGPYADCPHPLGGDVYSDASGSFPKCLQRRRIAYIAVVVHSGKPQTCVSGILDYPLQTIVAGELEASAMAARYSPPHSLNHVDCETIEEPKGERPGAATPPDHTPTCGGNGGPRTNENATGPKP